MRPRLMVRYQSQAVLRSAVEDVGDAAATASVDAKEAWTGLDGRTMTKADPG